jgi:hypothetical protein
VAAGVNTVIKYQALWIARNFLTSWATITLLKLSCNQMWPKSLDWCCVRCEWTWRPGSLAPLRRYAYVLYIGVLWVCIKEPTGVVTVATYQQQRHMSTVTLLPWFAHGLLPTAWKLTIHCLSFVCLFVCFFVCCMIYSSVINADAALSAETAVNWHQTTRSHIRVDCARHTHSYN